VGDVHYAKGTFVGVIMNNPALGKNNGMCISLVATITYTNWFGVAFCCCCCVCHQV
jgi:Na+-translocating ferredoxin:NAD+ oxidoreductase RnfE subunit